MLPSEKEAKSICDKLLGYARADDAVVSIESEVRSHLRFAGNAFTTNGSSRERSFSVKRGWPSRRQNWATSSGETH